MAFFDFFSSSKKFDIGAPAAKTPLEEVEFLAVDMETTGLEPEKNQIVSIGWVPVIGNQIQFSGADYVLIKGVEVGQSATIHHLTDSDLEGGCGLEEGIGKLLDALSGKAMIAHFAAIETGFINHACMKLHGSKPALSVVDTFALERRHMERMGTYPRGEDLRLARVRTRYGLPRYGNHNALTDALACAELYLAMIAHRPQRRLSDLQKNLQISGK